MADDFETGATLNVRPDPASLRDARRTIESELGDIEVDVIASLEGGGGAVGNRSPESALIDLNRRQLGELERMSEGVLGGGDNREQRRRRREFRWARQQLTLSEERNEVLISIADDIEDGGGGGGLLSAGGAAGLGAGIGRLAGRAGLLPAGAGIGLAGLGIGGGMGLAAIGEGIGSAIESLPTEFADAIPDPLVETPLFETPLFQTPLVDVPDPLFETPLFETPLVESPLVEEGAVTGVESGAVEIAEGAVVGVEEGAVEIAEGAVVGVEEGAVEGPLIESPLAEASATDSIVASAGAVLGDDNIVGSPGAIVGDPSIETEFALDANLNVSPSFTLSPTINLTGVDLSSLQDDVEQAILDSQEFQKEVQNVAGDAVDGLKKALNRQEGFNINFNFP